ncbi:hypothetical protein CFC21_108606 [Triticum aestivum]|uniref:PGG domain-containing protein n=2 Tax=Triticum aestivum TaxID=4565 RepID=A0A9R1NBV3_WHEAT|nr:uncharacterized protein LOC123165624 [Triticum aestivum]KAF7108056.1 hypothetical protein CFC21_108604 [Triticum aestivum]KAF7108057.1 hypothetical protein CFC21_108606 [Triticum aestivum]
MVDSGEQNGNGHASAAAGNTPVEPQQLQQEGADEAVPQQLQQEGADEEELLWKLRKYLVLMAILVAAITFQAGLAPPGGFWQDNDEHGHVASDIVMRSSYPRRYLVFFYCNTTAFGASLMVLILLLLRELTHKAVWLRALQFAMILGLLGLMGAYAAGSCREVRTSVYIWVLLVGIFAYVTLHVVFFKHLAPKKLQDLLSGISESWKETLRHIFMPSKTDIATDVQEAPVQMEELIDLERSRSSVLDLAEEEKRKIAEEAAKEREEKENLERNRSSLLVLATLVATVTYVAGLTPPGGFWSDGDNSHIAGDPVLRDHYPRRFKAFLICNATAFAGSLVIIIMVLSQTAMDYVVKSNALRLCVVVSLFGLMGAYAAGSCREVHTSIYVFALVGAVLLYLIIQCVELALSKLACIANTITRVKERNKEMVQKVRDFIKALMEPDAQGQSNNGNPGTDVKNDFQKLRTYLLLLGILAATVTFQAGMNPPGGFWTDNSDGHIPGDPILETISPKRYKAFFYCNATAFVASLAIIILLQSQLITIHAMKRHVLQTAMTLVLFGLMGAYVAGSSRKFSTSIYVFVLVLLVFAYVVLHTLYVPPILKIWWESIIGASAGSADTPEDKDLRKRRKFLILLAILAASITYQTGISPPGGFWTDNKNGHRAGYSVFRDEFRERYRLFFYFNATAFMASLAVILLLVSKRLCDKGLKCYALRACVLADLISLIGAFATGSCRKVSTSFYVILVVVAVFVYVILQVLLLKFAKEKANCSLLGLMFKFKAKPSEHQDSLTNRTTSTSDTDSKRTEHKWRKDLMLIGTLAITVTYQAGLLPPGGVWPDDKDGHFAGDPILHDTNQTRYKVFFYCNATAFMASMVMVILLLNNTISKYKRSLFAMKTAMVLDLLGLLGAYAAGSCRKLKTSAYIFALVIAVIIYIVVHVLLSFDKVARLVKEKGKEWVQCLKRCFGCN